MKDKTTDELLKQFLKEDKSVDDILSELPELKKEAVIEKIQEIKTETETLAPNVIVEETEITVEPLVEIKEVIIEKIVEKEVIPKEALIPIIEGINELRSDIDMIKEAIVEILNKTLQSNNLFTEKLKDVNNQDRKKIIFNRDESGKITGAETSIITEESK